MKSEQSIKPQFIGCVELAPLLPAFIEFVDREYTWGIPSRQLEYFVLSRKAQSNGKKTTDLLVLAFKTRVAFLFGWRLEQMLDSLTQGQIKRIHTGEPRGRRKVGEPLVSEIFVVPRSATIPF